MKNKKVLAFDLDGTLTISKTPMTAMMADILVDALKQYEILIMSGSKWELFQDNIVSQLKNADEHYQRLHMMPTCGTTYYLFKDGEWYQEYVENLTDQEAEEIAMALEKHAKKLGFWEEETWGDIIEFRGSQVTYSALGQLAPPEEKYKWDPDHAKKNKLRDAVAQTIPQFDVKVGGKTSIDVTRPGIDKSYGMQKFIDMHGYDKDHIIYFGDMLHEGGNDYPIKAMGIETVAVDNHEHTHRLISDFVNK